MEPKTIDGQLYWHYSMLVNWPKNNQARKITRTNWQKLLAELQRNGVEDAFKVDKEGIVYDGNNRLKGLRQHIENGLTKAENGIDLEWVPVIVKEYPTEASKWRAAMTRNEQFAQWDRESLANFMPEFENELDISLINIDFGQPLSIDEQLDLEGKDQPDKKKRSVTCPSCNHVFEV